MKERPLKEFMTPNPVTLNIDEPFCKVAQVFQERGIRHLPIVNNKGVLMGVMSQRDFHRIAAPELSPSGEYVYNMEELAKYVLKQHIIRQVVALKENDTLETAVTLMADQKLGCIPIVDEERCVVGIVTAIDGLKLLLKLIRQK